MTPAEPINHDADKAKTANETEAVSETHASAARPCCSADSVSQHGLEEPSSSSRPQSGYLLDDPGSDVNTSKATSRNKATSSKGSLLALIPVIAIAGAAGLFAIFKGKAGASAKAEHQQKKPAKKTKQQRYVKAETASTKEINQQNQAAGASANALPSEPTAPPPEVIPEDSLQLIASQVDLQPPSTQGLPLEGMTFVVSEDVAVVNTPITYGVDEWQQHTPESSSSSAPVVSRAVLAGAACIAKTTLQRAGLEMNGTNFGNILNKSRVAGGGHTGAAVSVARQEATFAIVTDALGEMRVPVACSGGYGYRPTPGVFGGADADITPGSPQASSLIHNVSIIGTSGQQLLKLAQVFGAPGSANIKGEILQFVVAQDLCEMCAPELQPAILAVKKAILKWAGSDQAGAVQLIRFLATHVSSWVHLIPGKPLARGFEAVGGQGIHVEDFLEAAVVAAQILKTEELHQRAGHIQNSAVAALAAAATASDDQQMETSVPPETAATTPADEAASAVDVKFQVQEDDSVQVVVTPSGEPSSTSDAPAAPKPGEALPRRPTKEQVAAAQRVAGEIHECFRTTVKPDTIMVLPALPFPPPKRITNDMELLMFTKLCQCFNALTTLSGCPTVVAPVGLLKDGSPVAVSLMAVQKFDQRLLAAAQKLVPMIHDSFRQVKEDIVNMANKQSQEASSSQSATTPATTTNRPSPASAPAPTSQKDAGKSGTSASSAAGTASSSQNGAALSPQPPPQQAPVDPKKVEKAEKAKAKGNEYFVAGKYLEALNEYTKAIGFHPNTHVYYSNRAMACIKLFRFEQAEEDCNRALTFDLSDKDKVKAMLRRATARDALQKYEGAEKDLRAVLRLEPNNKQAREDLQALRRHQAQMAESQAALVAQMRAQMAAGGVPGVNDPAAIPGMDPSMLPPGIDPSMFPPGFFEAGGASAGY